MTQENDIVLIMIEDKPSAFARIEAITADHKPGWYHVKMLLLQIPLQVITWILRDVYIDGDEYTMNGKRMRLEKVVCPEVPEEMTEEEPKTEAPKEKPKTEVPKEKPGKVISLADMKKKPSKD